MTRFLFDQFSKQFLEEFLTPLGTVERSREVAGESRQIDVFFAPSTQPAENPQVLGLLGRIAATPCLLEPFSDQPTFTEIRNCLLKLFSVHADLQRQANRESQRLSETELPHLWILAASASTNLLNSFAARPQDSWLPGVYFMGAALRSAIVSINQLPATEETLWVRILGRGATQQQAIDEVLAFPKADPRRSRALRVLATWKLTLETSGEITEADRSLVMALSQAYLEWEQETKRQGIQQERRATIENLLKVRFGLLDERLSALVPALLEMTAEEYTPLLLQLSREELIARFQDATATE